MKVKGNYFLSMRGVSSIKRNNETNYTIRNNRQRFFFPDEWMAFFDVLKDKQQITFNSLLNTGARINEMRNVRVADVDLVRQNIVLRVTKKVTKGKPKKGKLGVSRIRVVSISTKFAKYLKSLITKYKLNDNDYIPILSTPAANTAMKIALEKAGIKDWDMFSVHNVRKTLETWLLALEVDSLKLVKHFGHSLQIAAEHYVSSDVFSFEDKQMIRGIIGDLYMR